MSTPNESLLEADEHVLTTLEKDGSRRWLFPRLSPGFYWRARQLVGFALIVIFVGIPHIRMNGKPLILLDITAREFTLFGTTFLPTDTLLLALLMVSLFLTIFLLTALLGRVWCGWACPQTVYLEFVYRPIERFFMGTQGKGGVPRGEVAGWRYVGMYVTYFVLSIILAHTFLAYFVGIDRLAVWIRQSPVQHPVPFIVMVLTTGLMMFDFSFFREQLCLIACPYGRFQSVLLDRDSLIVSYDKTRGEPRGKVGKELPIAGQQPGDCVDCGLCVRTCPTGIDIRDGLQMECVHCTQCIDACDSIMAKLNRPLGLIRYSSQNGIDGKGARFLRPRTIIYPIILLVAVSILGWNLVTKKSFDVTLLRNYGLPFTISDSGLIQNSLRFKIVNRLETDDEFVVRVINPEGIELDRGDEPIKLSGRDTTVVPILVSSPKDQFDFGMLPATFEVTSKSGDRREIECKLIGP